MFERLLARGAALAERRARLRAREIAAAQLPAGVAAEVVDEGVVISGRGLRRRFALEPALRWLTERRG